MSAVRSLSLFCLLFLPFALRAAEPVAPPRTDPEPAEIAALRAKAEKGNGVAQYNLGLAYAQGRLVPMDLPEAFVWLSLASENGTAGQSLQVMLSKLTDEQLAEGQQRLIARRAQLADLQSKSAASRTPGSKKPTTLGFSLNIPSSPGTAETSRPPPDGSRSPSPRPPADSPAPSVEPVSPQQEIAALRNDKQQLAAELARTRKDLEQARADLQAANAELAAQRNGAARQIADAKAKP